MPTINITQKDINGIQFISRPGKYVATIIRADQVIRDGTIFWKMTLETDQGERVKYNLSFDPELTWKVVELMRALGYDVQPGGSDFDVVEVKNKRVAITVVESAALDKNGRPFMNVTRFDKADEPAF